MGQTNLCTRNKRKINCATDKRIINIIFLFIWPTFYFPTFTSIMQVKINELYKNIIASSLKMCYFTTKKDDKRLTIYNCTSSHPIHNYQVNSLEVNKNFWKQIKISINLNMLENG